MFGECHAHLFMNGRNYREAVRLHKNGAQETDIREKLQKYQELGVTFVRDGGDALVKRAITEGADLSSADPTSADAEVSDAMAFESLSGKDGRRLIEA